MALALNPERVSHTQWGRGGKFLGEVHRRDPCRHWMSRAATSHMCEPGHPKPSEEPDQRFDPYHRLTPSHAQLKPAPQFFVPKRIIPAGRGTQRRRNLPTPALIGFQRPQECTGNRPLKKKWHATLQASWHTLHPPHPFLLFCQKFSLFLCFFCHVFQESAPF